MKAITLNPTLKRNWEPIIHVLVLSFFIGEKWINNFQGHPSETKFFLTIATLTLPALFYANALWLIPAYLSSRKIMKYFVFLLMIVLLLEVVRALSYLAIFSYLSVEIDYGFQFQKLILLPYASLTKFIFSFSFIGISLSFAYRFTKDWINNEKEKQKLVADKLSAELNFLKSQINPHFLFNTLNNLFSISLKDKSEKTADGITNLSELMRYALFDAHQDSVLLKKEINFIKKYIALQKLRLTEDHLVEIHLKVDAIDDNHKVAPMILIPFIENAFQFGISFTKKSFIDISILVENDRLLLKVKNSVNKNAREVPGSGIGHRNVKSRLDMLYKEDYSLKISNKEDEYNVQLEIVLK